MAIKIMITENEGGFEWDVNDGKRIAGGWCVHFSGAMEHVAAAVKEELAERTLPNIQIPRVEFPNEYTAVDPNDPDLPVDAGKSF